MLVHLFRIGQSLKILDLKFFQKVGRIISKQMQKSIQKVKIDKNSSLYGPTF